MKDEAIKTHFEYM